MKPNGTVSRGMCNSRSLMLWQFVDTNPNYTSGSVPFDAVGPYPVTWTTLVRLNNRVHRSRFRRRFALDVGYNFDGTQNPVVQRLGMPTLPLRFFHCQLLRSAWLRSNPTEMSAYFLAAGPDIGRELGQVRNIDVAPTIEQLLDVKPDPTIAG